MYTIKVFNKDYWFLDRIDKFINLKVENYLNKESKSSFSVPNISRYSRTTFKKKNIVQIYRDEELLFEWLILLVNPSATQIDIDCESYSHILKYRFLTTSYSWTYDSVLSQIKSAWLNDWLIPVNFISSNLSWNISLELNKKSLKEAINLIQKSWKDYLYKWKDLIISDVIWEDKTYITLKFLENRSNENNIKNISVKEDWVEIVNKVLWYKDWLSPVNIQDNTSINDYWPYKEVVNFSEANDQATLQKLTEWYLNEHKRETITVDFKIEDTKFDTWLLNIWDSLNVKIKKWYLEVDENLRIVWKIYDISKSSNFSEEISFKISQWVKDMNDFFESISEMKNKISNLEKR